MERLLSRGSGHLSINVEENTRREGLTGRTRRGADGSPVRAALDRAPVFQQGAHALEILVAFGETIFERALS